LGSITALIYHCNGKKKVVMSIFVKKGIAQATCQWIR